MMVFFPLGHVERAFKADGFAFDYVINLAAETRYGQGDEVGNYLLHSKSTFGREEALG